jgi:hypothetical protein
MAGRRKLVGLLLVGAAVLLISSLTAVAGNGGAAPLTPGRAAGDLGVAEVPGLAQPGLDALTRPPVRPGILVAWRNTEKILETEVRVRNLGTEAARGQLTVDLLDADHRVLHSRPDRSTPFIIEVPAADRGGDIGLLVQVPGTLEMNRTLDALDRMMAPYCIRVTVDPLVPETKLADNVAVKCYNAAARMVPGGTVLHQFTLVNPSNRELRGVMHYGGPPPPRGWTITTEPTEGAGVRLSPHEALRGSVTVRGPARLDGPGFADIRPTLLRSGTVVDQSEFFVAADDTRPEFTEASASAGSPERPGTVYVQVRAADSGSGVAEASGASVIFSTDGGRSYARGPLLYSDGNFTAPTGFDGTLGPFPDGTEVTMFVVVRDVAGNETATKPVTVKVPVPGTVDLR